MAEAEELGVFIVILLGGEPLLREELIFSLVQAHPKMFFLLFTGTSCMTGEQARKANASNLLTLVATDDTGCRGRNVRQALGRAGAAFGFSAVVSESCADAFSSPEFVTTMAREGCRIGIFLERLPVGRSAAQGYGLSELSRSRFRKTIQDLQAETGLPLNFFPDDEAVLGGCGAAGRNVLHINADGGVEPCPFIHEALETLNDRALSEVLQSPHLSSVRNVACSRSADYPCALLEPQVIGALETS